MKIDVVTSQADTQAETKVDPTLAPPVLPEVIYGNFGAALHALRGGLLMTREGWNGKGMFVYYVPGSEFKVSRFPLDQIFAPGTEIEYRPHIDMKYADGTCGVWVPSQSDILAEDWRVADAI